ncbi:MAG TPA: carbamoyltransferase HypF, partial [Bacillota bacterium]|nr:carbamoyltransferase HypF [Bacillota bacterium]
MKRLELTIAGRVQGVGFRPFLYQLARKYHLTGCVSNTPGGVSLQVQGTRSNLLCFLRQIRTTSPPQGKVQRIAVKALPVVADETDFVIAASQTDGAVTAVLPPDLATCEQCLQEIMAPENRRHRYPFTNCTDCGPRFTIVQALPYDRHMTTMAGFNMCEACGREYHSPSDRRFHAQPNACPRCGPSLRLLIPDQATGKLRRESRVDPLATTVTAFKEGQLAVIKGLGGYHLAAAATNLSAVERIRRIKGREGKPLAIMCRDLEQVKMICAVAPGEIALLTASARPIVILRKLDSPQIRLAEAVAPGQDSVGVMLPYTPLHHLIMEAFDQPLVMTSANQGDQPIAITEDELVPELLREVAVVLSHNRPIAARCDDSVVIAAPEQIFLRRSRGYVPEPLSILPFRQALGIGADFKNTACFIRDREAYFTQHIGNLDDEPAQNAARQGIEHMSRLFDLHPEVVGCDLHPEYRSRQYAATLDLPLVTVQHHHAHILSCMAEHRLTGPVLGVAFDGTGFGTDGTIWGGEFLVADYTGFTRAAALRPVGMPGGERVVREPWRMALSYLYEIFGSQIPDFPGLERLYNCGGDLLLPLLIQRLN